MYEAPVSNVEILMDPVNSSHGRWETPIDPDTY